MTKCNNWALLVSTPTALWLVKKKVAKPRRAGFMIWDHWNAKKKIDRPCLTAASMPPSIRFRGGICCPRTLAMTGFRRLAAGWSPPSQAGGWGKEKEWRRDHMPFAQTSQQHTQNRNWRTETCALVLDECVAFLSVLNESLIISRHRWRTLVPFDLTMGCSKVRGWSVPEPMQFWSARRWVGHWWELRFAFWSRFVPVESWWVWIGRWPMTSKVTVEGN